MLPLSIDLDAHKELILQLHKKKQTSTQISTYLRIHHHCSVSYRIIERRLESLDVPSLRIRTDETAELRFRIAVLFFHWCLKDTNMLHVLNQEGCHIGKQAPIRIRQDLGFQRKVSIWNREELDRDLYCLVEQEYEKKLLKSYGRGLLYSHFRKNGHIITR